MYSVFLVEDEIVTREGIRNSIPWERTPYTLAGEAPDGEMALPVLRDVKPDILITDIKMPFLDGLALSRIIKKDQPWIKIIILSGHDEFQYAKEAISIGIEEYLLKPVSSLDMLETLKKVTKQIEEEKKQLTDIESLKMKIQTSEEVVRDKWISDLVTGQIDSSRAIESAGSLGIDLIANGFVVLIAEISIETDEYAQYSMAKTVIASLVKERDDVLLFSQSVEKQGILLKNVSPESLDDSVYSLAQAIKFKIERTTDCRVSIGIGSVVEHLGEIVRSYADADKAVRYMTVTGKNRIIGVNDMQWNQTRDTFWSEGFANAEQMRTPHHAMILKAKKYIEENYMSQDMSLNSVASYVNVSPNHFSTLFSQEAGETFIEYLTMVRMNNAKELLSGSGMKCADIAYEIGYSDPHYFSYIFKKSTGVSPSDYRLACSRQD